MDFLRNNRLAFHLLMGALLVVIYPMQELFSGNQNVYFLWGVADIMPHTFTADPLLNSPDPYPFFSWLISIFPSQFLGVWTTILYLILNAIYSFALFGIADGIGSIYKHKEQFYSFSALFLILHCSPIWGTYSSLVFDVDLRWIWDSGIAEQGVLRGYLQPSVFGVFLLLSMLYAMRRNFAVAILCIAPAASIHAGYLFLGGFLTILFVLLSNFEKKSLLVSGLLLLIVSPYCYYILENFVQIGQAATDSINAAVLAGYENNIHLNPNNWLNAKFFVQLTVLLFGALSLWRTRMRGPFFGILVIGIGLTTVAYIVNLIDLISLNPWRVSVILMPLATVAMLTHVVKSGIWSIVRPHILSLILIASVALVFYRLFGNGSDEFLYKWKIVQLAAFLLAFILAGYIFKIEIFGKLLEPGVVATMILLGCVDNYVDGISKASSDQYSVISSVAKTQEPNTIYIVPPSWSSFRMNAKKVVYADENLVYGPALPDLMERLKLCESASESDNYSMILESIPSELSVKLIAPSSTNVTNPLSEDALSHNFVCYTLR